MLLQKKKKFSLLFPRGSEGEESDCNTEDLGLIAGLRRSPGEWNGYLPQYSCLENSTDRGAWRATVSPWSFKESDVTGQLTLSLTFR